MTWEAFIVGEGATVVEVSLGEAGVAIGDVGVSLGDTVGVQHVGDEGAVIRDGDEGIRDDLPTRGGEGVACGGDDGAILSGDNFDILFGKARFLGLTRKVLASNAGTSFRESMIYLTFDGNPFLTLWKR